MLLPSGLSPEHRALLLRLQRLEHLILIPPTPQLGTVRNETS